MGSSFLIFPWKMIISIDFFVRKYGGQRCEWKNWNFTSFQQKFVHFRVLHVVRKFFQPQFFIFCGGFRAWGQKCENNSENQGEEQGILKTTKVFSLTGFDWIEVGKIMFYIDQFITNTAVPSFQIPSYQYLIIFCFNRYLHCTQSAKWCHKWQHFQCLAKMIFFGQKLSWSGLEFM